MTNKNNEEYLIMPVTFVVAIELLKSEKFLLLAT